MECEQQFNNLPDLKLMFSDWSLDLGDRGIFITDARLNVRNWNSWLVEKTGLSEKSVVGRNLFEIFPDLVDRKLDSYFRQALDGRVSLLSHSFHRHLLPISTGAHDGFMPQSVRIVPLAQDGNIMGTATLIENVNERVERERALIREVEVNSTLALLAKELISSNDIAEISDLVLQFAKKLTGSVFGYVGNIDPLTGYLVSTAHSGAEINDCRVVEGDILFKEFRGLCGWVLKNRHPILTNDAANDPRSAGIPEGHMPIRQFLSVPAMQGDVLLGQIALANPKQDYTSRDQEVVERLAVLYSMSLNRNLLEATRQKTFAELQEALARIKVLKEILPICMYCKKIRDDDGYWDQLDMYVRKHTDSEFSHGICPDCLQKHYPGVAL